jgi:hypothetical protein
MSTSSSFAAVRAATTAVFCKRNNLRRGDATSNRNVQSITYAAAEILVGRRTATTTVAELAAASFARNHGDRVLLLATEVADAADPQEAAFVAMKVRP